MEVKAILKNLRLSPNKVRLVADLVRKLSVNDAVDQLAYSQKSAAKPMLKLFHSAIANAKHNHQLSADELFIKKLMVNMGTTIFRYMPRAHGRAYPIRKKISTVELVLGKREGEGLISSKEVPSKATLKV